MSEPTERRSSRLGTIALCFAVDVVLVTTFAAIGRASHGEQTFAGLWQTAWPFLAALVVGWLVTLAWRAPAAPVRTGLGHLGGHGRRRNAPSPRIGPRHRPRVHHRRSDGAPGLHRRLAADRGVGPPPADDATGLPVGSTGDSPNPPRRCSAAGRSPWRRARHPGSDAALAVYEREPDAVENTVEALGETLFGDDPRAFTHVVERDGEIVGIAIWFLTYSNVDGPTRHLARGPHRR